jgi:hypothetical protein
MVLSAWFIDADSLPTRLLTGTEADEAAAVDAAGREFEKS